MNLKLRVDSLPQEGRGGLVEKPGFGLRIHFCSTNWLIYISHDPITHRFASKYNVTGSNINETSNTVELLFKKDDMKMMQNNETLQGIINHMSYSNTP